jgi:putative heme-binding domain-containing protein
MRREVAFFFRNQPASPEIIEALVKIAQKYDGEDRAYLEAFGTGATGKEGDVFAALVKNAKAGDWNATTAAAVWRLMTPPAVPALRDRVFLVSLPEESRMEALESIAFIRSSSAADAMVDIANLAPDKALSKRAAFWVKWNNDRWWKSYKPADKLKGGNAKRELVSIVTPEDPGGSKLPSAEEILKLEADAARGKIVATRCVICHVIDKVGVDVGPNLTGWGQRFPREVIVRAILEPSAEISLGFEGQHIVTKSGHDIMGIVLSHGDPVIVKSMGGVTQAIPANDIKSRTKMKRSLMLSANQQQLTAQDVADVVEYLRRGE